MSKLPEYQAAGGYPHQGAPYYPPQGAPSTYPGYPQPPQFPGVQSFPAAPSQPPPYSATLPSAPQSDDEEFVFVIPGYENATHNDAFIMPPAMPVSSDPPPIRTESIRNTILLSDEVRDAVAEYCQASCCAKSDVSTAMIINNVDSSSAYHYIFETYTERRETSIKSVPFTSNSAVIPGLSPPDPWSVQVQIPGFFRNGKVHMEIPNTAVIKKCRSCRGSGHMKCRHCDGRGVRDCSWCHGRDNDCTSCHGSRGDRCTWCHGRGHKSCDDCNGHCLMKHYVQLTVIWNTHKDEYVMEGSCLQEKFIQKAQGDVVFREDNPMVWPITGYFVNQINQASAQIVSKHAAFGQQERILRQRHRLEVVPLSEVNYTYKDKAHTLVVYGIDKKVYARDFPSACCTII